jgi:uncharacterized membrane protein
MEYWLFRIGSVVCHQAPDRTISIGSYLPLCARCTGIYTGFLLGIVYQFALWQMKIKKLPVFKISILSSLVLAILIVDAIGSYLQLWVSPNYIKLILGMLGGSSISLFLFPVFNFSLIAKRKKEEGMTRWKEYAGLIVLLGLAVFFIISGKPVFYYPAAVGAVEGMIMLYLMLLLTFVFRISRSVHAKFSQRGNHAAEQ